MRFKYSTSVAAIIVATASGGVAEAQYIGSPGNVNAAALLSPFTALPIGGGTLTSNLNFAISINNNPANGLENAAFARAQALIDNTITTENGVVISDAFGSKMFQVYNSVNNQLANGSTTTFSNNVRDLFRQINGISQADSGLIKNYFANGTTNGFPTNTPVPGTITAGAPIVTQNVYDLSYNPPPATKNKTGDSRPFQVNAGAIQSFSGVDYFGNPTSNTTIQAGLSANASFPSGHTTFGYTQALLFAMLVPERFQQFMTRASEYGNSRVVLGVHYPLDVIGGRVLATYDVVQMLNNNPDYLNQSVNVFAVGAVTTTNNFQTLFNSARTDLRNLLQQGCGTNLTACSTTSASDRFSNYAQMKAFYNNNLNYGLGPFGMTTIPTALFPALGTGPEVLLSTRFPYLTMAQRQDVLATTGLPAGQPMESLDPRFEVYSRLNLFAAADGYGFFNSAVSVNQDPSQCPAGVTFCTFDMWRNDIGGAGSFTKTGAGTLMFTGNDTYTGGTNVNGGNLLLFGGTLASAVTVGTGAMFGGIGTVNSNVIVNGGTFAAGLPNVAGLTDATMLGSTPGRFNISGNLQLNGGSNYLVQLMPGITSLTTVTGTASIAGGSTASAFFNPGIYNVGSKVAILTSNTANGVTGTFSSLSFNSAGINVTPTLSYDGQDAFLTFNQALLPALPGGAPTNAASVLGALNGAVNHGATLPGSLQNLFALSLNPSAYAFAMNQIGNQTGVGAALDIGLTMNGFLGTMFDFSAPGRQEVGTGTASGFAPERQVAPEVALAYAAVTPKGAMPTKASPLVYDPRWNVWASAFGGGARVLGDNVIGSQTFNSNIFGGAAGADYRMTRDATVGFAVSGGQTNYALANSFGTGQTDFFQAGAYGKQRFGNAYVAAAVAGGEHQVKTDRFVTLGPAAVDHLTASFTASTIAGRLEGGYRYGIPTAGVTPYGAVQVQNVWTPAYTEAVAAGGGGAAQSVASRDVTTTRTELGAWFDTVLNTVTYRARAAWVHDFNRNASITETFATLPGASFVINGAQRPGDAALLSSMLEAPIGSNVALSARVDGEFATRATTWAGNVKLRYFW